MHDWLCLNIYIYILYVYIDVEPLVSLHFPGFLKIKEKRKLQRSVPIKRLGKDTSSPDPRSEANSPWTWRCGGWTMWASSSRCWRCAKSALPFAQMILLVFISLCVCVSGFACICQEHGDRCCDHFVERWHLTEKLLFWSALLFVAEMFLRMQWLNLKPPFFGWHVKEYLRTDQFLSSSGSNSRLTAAYVWLSSTKQISRLCCSF